MRGRNCNKSILNLCSAINEMNEKVLFQVYIQWRKSNLKFLLRLFFFFSTELSKKLKNGFRVFLGVTTTWKQTFFSSKEVKLSSDLKSLFLFDFKAFLSNRREKISFLRLQVKNWQKTFSSSPFNSLQLLL